VIGICLAASVGILVVWFLDMKVYHELLHDAFREGVKLEREFPQYLPQIRENMVKSQRGGDIIKSVMLYYFFSVMLLVVIANVAVWMFIPDKTLTSIGINSLSAIVLIVVFRLLSRGSSREF